MIITDLKQLERFRAERRLWQGIPTVCITRNGRLFVSFYSGGTKEYYGNYCILESRAPNGSLFGGPVAAVYLGEAARAFDPCLWIDPFGRLWWIYNVMPEYAAYACICDDPDADELKFGDPFMIGSGCIINKPTVLSTGEWLFCASVWKKGDFQCIPSPHCFPIENILKTVDHGKTFRVLGGVEVPEKHFGESMVIELSDGALRLYTRTRYGISESTSFDGGITWIKPRDSGLGGPDSRFYVGKLKSGRYLLVNHKNFSGRNNLYAMTSFDADNWSDGILIDGRDNVSYPDVAEDDDGSIYIVYDRERGAYCKSAEECMSKPREILLAKITERDIAERKIVTDGSALRIIADKLGAYAADDGEDPFSVYGDGVKDYIRTLSELDSGDEILSIIFRDYGNCCFSINDEERRIIDDNCTALNELDGCDDICRKITAVTHMIEIFLRYGNDACADSLNGAFIDRVRLYVGRNLSDTDLRLDKMADDLKISKFYMCHVFKDATGTTIAQYINFRRLAVAKRLLSGTSRSVVSVGMEIGFTDPGYFSKWFKKAEGITPLRYRELTGCQSR